MSYSSPSPEEILAFSEKYARRLYSSKRWQRFDREDFTQELAIKLLKAAERYDPSKGVPWTQYAYIIARGAYLDFYRKINNHEELIWDSHQDTDGEYVDSLWENLLAVEDFIDFTPSEIIEWSKKFSKQRQKVIICLALGYTKTEIAEFLQVSQSRVTRLVRAIQSDLISLQRS